ncbi:hypothetical protein DPQ33_03030 [Oceanidesulfovibrio indonesiensis]|uniref:histidine kinase n=1 Tax=Oceanidesulfovibrio indonesiensis TaxID=54767 RepID=A0A7M3MI28_9BACT|nr:hypothetical protein DPQ33_03030 [Oceanidesulfovibrio indonesiensis]
MSESPPIANGAYDNAPSDGDEHSELEALRERVAELERERGDHARARDELLEQRIAANALLNASSDSLIVLDQLGTILAINDAGVRRFGGDAASIRGRNIFDFIEGETHEHMRHWFKEAVETQKSVQFKVGTDFATYGYRLTPSSEPGTNAVRVALLIRDISENERALIALRESEARYRGILEDQTELICRYLPDGRLSYVNEAYARHFGKTPRELINTNFIPHIPDEDVVLIRSRIAGLSPENPVTSFEHRVIMDNGEVHWHHWTHRAIYSAQNELVEYQAVGRSITKRKKAQLALQESEARYRSLFEDSPISLWVEDFSLVKEYLDFQRHQGVTDFRRHFDENPLAVAHCAGLVSVRDVNKATVKLFNAHDKSELLSSLEAVFVDETLDHFKDEIVALAEGQRTFTCETRHRTLDGDLRDVIIHISVAPGSEHRLDMILVSLLDVTQRKRMEMELDDSRNFLHQIVDTVPSPIFVKDREGRFIMVNKAMADIYGASPQELIGKTGADFNPNEDETSLFRIEDLEVLDSNQPLFIPQRVITSISGETRWFSTTKLPLKGKDQVLGVAVDITERKEAEAERTRLEKHFRQAQKMQALGTLAGGIAHDFNNMIFAILGFVRLALRNAEPGSKMEEYLKQVHSASMRASDLVRQILTFSRQTEQERKPVAVASLVKETAKLLRATLPTTIDMHVEIEPEAEGEQSSILGDPTQVHQVIMNLCTNAGHAMRMRGGDLTVHLGLREVTPESARNVLEQNPGTFVELTVSDTGHGIDPAIMEQIYDPFFTTKEPGEGTGMGLSVVHGIVKSHGGTVHVDSEVGVGTTFTILLPRLVQTEEELNAQSSIYSPRGDEHILFVDDEALLVQMAEETLSQLGYSVTATTSPTKALEMFSQTPDAFDIVITDQTMPGMTGMELARTMLAAKPDLPIVLMTGYSEAVTSDIARQSGLSEYLMKPVVEEELAQTIRHVLDRVQ